MKKRDFYAQYPGPAGAGGSVLVYIVALALAAWGLWWITQVILTWIRGVH